MSMSSFIAVILASCARSHSLGRHTACESSGGVPRATSLVLSHVQSCAVMYCAVCHELTIRNRYWRAVSRQTQRAQCLSLATALADFPVRCEQYRVSTGELSEARGGKGGIFVAP